MGPGLRLATWLAAVAVAAAAQAGAPAQDGPGDGATAPLRRAPPARAVAVAAVTPGAPGDWHARRGPWFRRHWGVDIVGVHRVASGSMLRFTYKVVEPGRASALTDRKARPYLIDEATRTALAVPAMENVGELRQVAPLERDRTYFVIFGNPGGLVKRGGKVTLVVGDLRADGLVVD
jgi:hypothetical protein